MGILPTTERDVESEAPEHDAEDTEIEETDSEDTSSESGEEPSGKEDKEAEVPKDESARETVARILKEAKDKGSKNEDGTKSEAADPVEKKPENKIKADKFDPDLTPPARLKAHEKEIFNTLPKGLKKAWSRSVRELESTTTKANQEIAEKGRFYASIEEAISPYRDSWRERNLSDAQAIGALALAHKKLSNPETKEQAYIALGHDIGLGHLVAKKAGEPTSQSEDIASHPYVKSLEEKINQLQSRVEPVITNIEGQRQAEFSKTVEQEVSEMETLRNETNQSGKYLYPELHDDEFLERTKPLVSVYARVLPHLSAAERLKKAWSELTGNPISGSSGVTNQTRLPASNNQPNRAISAAVSVRGKSNPAKEVNQPLYKDEEIPDDPRETVRFMLKRLREGRGA